MILYSRDVPMFEYTMQFLSAHLKEEIVYSGDVHGHTRRITKSGTALIQGESK